MFGITSINIPFLEPAKNSTNTKGLEISEVFSKNRNHKDTATGAGTSIYPGNQPINQSESIRGTFLGMGRAAQRLAWLPGSPPVWLCGTRSEHRALPEESAAG